MQNNSKRSDQLKELFRQWKGGSFFFLKIPTLAVSEEHFRLQKMEANWRSSVIIVSRMVDIVSFWQGKGKKNKFIDNLIHQKLLKNGG